MELLMTLGDDPFGNNKNLRGVKPIEFFIVFLLVW
jgi:hypothetical protein